MVLKGDLRSQKSGPVGFSVMGLDAVAILHLLAHVKDPFNIISCELGKTAESGVLYWNLSFIDFLISGA